MWNNSGAILEVVINEDEDICTQSTTNTSRPVSIENSLERYINKFKDIKDNFERARCYNFQESDSEDDSNRNRDHSDTIYITYSDELHSYVNASCHHVYVDRPVRFCFKYRHGTDDTLLLSAYDDNDDDIFTRLRLDTVNPFFINTFYKQGFVNISCELTNSFITRIEVLSIDKR